MNDEEIMNLYIDEVSTESDKEIILASIRKARADERQKIIRIIDLACWNKELCPYCSYPMKQSHYCEQCQERVITGTMGDGIYSFIMDELKKQLAQSEEKT